MHRCSPISFWVYPYALKAVVILPSRMLLMHLPEECEYLAKGRPILKAMLSGELLCLPLYPISLALDGKQ